MPTMVMSFVRFDRYRARCDCRQSHKRLMMRIFMLMLATNRFAHEAAISAMVCFEGLGDVPVGIVRLHLAQVAVVADVVADAVLVDVAYSICLRPVNCSTICECFEDGAGILLAAAEVVDFAATRVCAECAT